MSEKSELRKKEIQKMYLDGKSVKQIARYFNVTEYRINEILRACEKEGKL